MTTNNMFIVLCNTYKNKIKEPTNIKLKNYNIKFIYYQATMRLTTFIIIFSIILIKAKTYTLELDE